MYKLNLNNQFYYPAQLNLVKLINLKINKIIDKHCG